MNQYLKLAGLSVLLVLFAVGANAQLTTVFEENFEYADNAAVVAAGWSSPALLPGVTSARAIAGATSIAHYGTVAANQRTAYTLASALDTSVEPVRVTYWLYDANGQGGGTLNGRAGLAIGTSSTNYLFIGAYHTTSITHYVVRAMDGGADWQVTTAPRSVGWQKFTTVMDNGTVEFYHNDGDTPVYTDTYNTMAGWAWLGLGSPAGGPYVDAHYDAIKIQTGSPQSTVVVDQTGAGDFTTIAEAVASFAPGGDNSTAAPPYTINVVTDTVETDHILINMNDIAINGNGNVSVFASSAVNNGAAVYIVGTTGSSILMDDLTLIPEYNTAGGATNFPGACMRIMDEGTAVSNMVVTLSNLVITGSTVGNAPADPDAAAPANITRWLEGAAPMFCSGIRVDATAGGTDNFVYINDSKISHSTSRGIYAAHLSGMTIEMNNTEAKYHTIGFRTFAMGGNWILNDCVAEFNGTMGLEIAGVAASPSALVEVNRGSYSYNGQTAVGYGMNFTGPNTIRINGTAADPIRVIGHNNRGIRFSHADSICLGISYTIIANNASHGLDINELDTANSWSEGIHKVIFSNNGSISATPNNFSYGDTNTDFQTINITESTFHNPGGNQGTAFIANNFQHRFTGSQNITWNFTDCIFSGNAGDNDAAIHVISNTNTINLVNCAVVTEGPYALSMLENGTSGVISQTAVINANPEYFHTDLDEAGYFDVTNAAYGGAGSAGSDLSGGANYNPMNTYTLTYSAGEGGSIIGNTLQYVHEGMDGTPVEAIQDYGYYFVQWSDGLTNRVRQDTGVTEDISVVAQFASFGPSTQWEYFGSASTPGLSTAIIRLAADSTGKVYLSDGPANPKSVYYSEDILTAATPTYTLLVAEDTAPANNGMQGFAFDGDDNVYITWDWDGANPGWVRKYDSAGSLLWQATPGLRPTGVGLLSDGNLVVTTFSGFRENRDAATGALIDSATDPSTGNFLRGIAVVDDVIYGVRTGSLIAFSGGGPGDMAGYDTIDVISAKGDTSFQVRPSVHYSSFDNTLIFSNMTDDAVYIVDYDSGAEIQALTESAPGVPFDNPGGVVTVDGNDGYYYLIVSTSTDQLSIFRKAYTSPYLYDEGINYAIYAGPSGDVFDQAEALLGVAASDADIIQGIAGTITFGGFHGAAVGDAANLTNGTFDPNGLTVLGRDTDGNSEPSFSIEYDFIAGGEVADVTSIRIFSGHAGDGGSRAFLNVKVEVDLGFGYTEAGNLRTGSFGLAAPGGSDSAVAYVEWSGSLTDVEKIQFTFENVSHSSTGFFQAPDDNLTDPPLNYPNQGSIIKEIDVFGSVGPTEVKEWMLY